MKKVVRNGKVAVLISYGYGAGWSTWNTDYPELLYHPVLVDMVEKGEQSEITAELCYKILGIEDNDEHYIYAGGAEGLSVEWVDEGRQFIVEEYDGTESLCIKDNINFHIA